MPDDPMTLIDAHMRLHAWEYGTQPEEDVTDGIDTWWREYSSKEPVGARSVPEVE